jgi:DNA polymerase III epsilon subunit-like protein
LDIFFDTETSGLPKNPQLSHTEVDNWPRLVQIAWVLIDENKKVIQERMFIVKPEGFVISESVTSVHGISTEKALAEGTPINEVLIHFMSALEKADYVVGHNIRFDRKVVAAELYRAFFGSHLDGKLYGTKYRDTMHVARDYVKIPATKKSGFKFPKLQEMYISLFGKPFEHAHNPIADINATIECFWKLDELGLVSQFYSTHKDQSTFEG